MKYIVFDLEATCEKDNRDFVNEIIEIGAVKINEDLEIVCEFSSFVKPVLNPILTDFCKKLTTISQKDVDDSAILKEVLDKFIDWIGEEDYMLCSWGFYDKSQFMKDCELHKVQTSWLKNHISLKHQHGKKIMGAQKGVGMGKALSAAGLNLRGTHHRGIDDARNIAQIFIKYFDIWDF